MFDTQTKAVIHEQKRFLGTATNNEAEYQGLIMGLEFLVSSGQTALPVIIEGDSKLVISQMQGIWKVKAVNLISYYDTAVKLTAQLTKVEFKWIPRNLNGKADSLCNSAFI